MNALNLWIVPGILAVYALSFIAGGLYYLEQRVSRIRDQLPRQAPLAALTGYAALCIGVLAAAALTTHFTSPSTDAHMALLVATVSGVGFWIYRLYTDHLPWARLRDMAMALLCLALSLLSAWWARINISF